MYFVNGFMLRQLEKKIKSNDYWRVRPSVKEQEKFTHQKKIGHGHNTVLTIQHEMS